LFFATISVCNAVFALCQLILWAYGGKCIAFSLWSTLHIWISETKFLS